MPVVLVEQYCDFTCGLMVDNDVIDREEVMIAGTTSVMVEVNVH